MMLAMIYKDGACTKALIMDITAYLVKLYQLVQQLLQGMSAMHSIASSNWKISGEDDGTHGARAL